MLRSMRATAAIAAALISFTSIAGPASAAPPQNLFQMIFNPPPGMSVTAQQPQNGLTLRQKYRLNPMFMRQVVPFRTDERVGTIVVDTEHHFLYLVLGEGKALRYGIGVARDGFEWSGIHNLTNKREWPGWTPPAEMKKRRPDLPNFMPGGPENPLGARALYIGSTLYRIHGTNEPWTIGGNVSSGCIRMVNDDVIDLYERVRVGAKVIVM
jgi:lipoprotein-anchoring transpeptidase ErfK/SrfK